nr:immunoglobulin heavy chain junction region [Macaca mulatta]MOV54643.1 immunoglobulin heavy chain junction region [Macaca mulatta]MOV55389.1 immunoglobulin heavy chain junction region [Macaca mulatta]MOV56635.1 immunoglobulin heavy chain junction region [Macaca mulatta]MOV57903.1 immunoglobulin heavy chain junction region [Macaca mulatta]
CTTLGWNYDRFDVW